MKTMQMTGNEARFRSITNSNWNALTPEDKRSHITHVNSPKLKIGQFYRLSSPKIFKCLAIIDNQVYFKNMKSTVTLQVERICFKGFESSCKNVAVFTTEYNDVSFILTLFLYGEAILTEE